MKFSTGSSPHTDETKEEAEVAILKGLRYLELEAKIAELRKLATTINRGVVDYLKNNERDEANQAE